MTESKPEKFGRNAELTCAGAMTSVYFCPDCKAPIDVLGICTGTGHVIKPIRKGHLCRKGNR